MRGSHPEGLIVNYISRYLYLHSRSSRASVARFFLLMYVNGKQLGELIHGVGSRQVRLMPLLQSPYVVGGRRSA